MDSKELIEILQKNPNVKIEIEVYVDSNDDLYGGFIDTYEIKDDVLTLKARE